MGRSRLLEGGDTSSLPTIPNFLHYFLRGPLAPIFSSSRPSPHRGMLAAMQQAGSWPEGVNEHRSTPEDRESRVQTGRGSTRPIAPSLGRSTAGVPSTPLQALG